MYFSHHKKVLSLLDNECSYLICNTINFAFQNNLRKLELIYKKMSKNLDPFYKKDLDFRLFVVTRI